jgi:hypothetical protein
MRKLHCCQANYLIFSKQLTGEVSNPHMSIKMTVRIPFAAGLLVGSPIRKVP